MPSSKGGSLVLPPRSRVLAAVLFLAGAAAHDVRAQALPGPSGPTSKILSPTPGDFYQFGSALALDGPISIVGAPFDGAVGLDAGAAYVFEESGVAWPFKQRLSPPFGASQTWFGWSVAADESTAAVGALFSDQPNGAADAGSVYVYQKPTGPTGYAFQVELFAPNPNTNDQFGHDVALSGNTLLVGAPLDDNTIGPQNEGLVHVFEKQAGTWKYKTVLRAFDGATGDNFGFSVAIDGDRAVVGAPGESTAGADSGAVYVFLRTQGVWSFEGQLAASNAQAGDRFGWDVAVAGSTLVVGAPGQGLRGAVYVFDAVGPAGNWVQSSALIPNDEPTVAQFGTSVALDIDRLVAGAPSFGLAPPSTGSAKVFDRDVSGAWQEVDHFAPADALAGDRVGHAVAVDCATSLVAAPFQGDFLYFVAGAAYTFKDYPDAESYCAPKTSSTGCAGQITASGVPSLASPVGYFVTATQIMNGKNGGLLYGTTGPASLPFSGGTLCLALPIHRGPLQASGGSPTGSDCSGTFLLDFKDWFQNGDDENLFVGSQINAQYWYRDPGDPLEIGLTDGVEFLWCP